MARIFRLCAGMVIIFLSLSLNGTAQYTQTIRGKVVDQLLQQPIAGATVQIVSINRSVITEEDGSFRITDVPIGNYHISVTHLSYKPSFAGNVIVNSGKEVVLNLQMETDSRLQQSVEVVGRSRKYRPLNDMSLVSARAFTVEETQRYAAAVNDPLRMATSFAGVMSADDGNNDIVIRGNSPTGLLWRMEGIEIPNPNHFSSAGTSGGGISILSSQLLANSDFVTGAFAAEYGNALSGVFDLHLRKGNNEKREYTLQAGLLGLNVAAEGPIMPFYKGSYLINYRYSTLQMLNKLGLDVGGGVTNFQDLSFNIYLPTVAKGEFTVFGFAGLSGQKEDIDRDSTKWDSEADRYGGTFKSNTTAVGITHAIKLGDRSQLKSAASYSSSLNAYYEDYLQKNGATLNSFNNNYRTEKVIVSSTLNHRLSNRSTVRAGVTGSFINYSYYLKSWNNPGLPVEEKIKTGGNTQTLQAFAQWQFTPVEKLKVEGGLHYLHLFLNNTSSLEPRAAIKYELDNSNAVSVGYGLHSQVQGLGVYFAKGFSPEGNVIAPNADLKFTRAHHFVLGYQHVFNKMLRFKAEAYYQRLFNAPVSIYDSLSFSVLNIRGDYISDALVNAGKGKNIGIDLTLEKNLGNNYYFILNSSVYRSTYTARDGVWRNTRFNGSRLTNLTGGKEWTLKEGKKVIGLNVKLIHAGGFRTTPIDIEQSQQKGYTVYREKEAFTVQNPDYFRADIRVSLKWNRKNLTSTLSLDVQNVTNRLNLYNQYYDPFTTSVRNSYQAGLIPIINYKVEF
ncbi:MAG: TonB-dependent receptor [Chitinophagaceae bacterium]|nr:TonB-dependent receptor [Chitinophagaceae bacterium]